MGKLQKYMLTTEEVARIKEAGKSVPYMIIGGFEPRSPAENQMDEWRKVAERLKVKVMTIVPDMDTKPFDEQIILAEPLEDL